MLLKKTDSIYKFGFSIGNHVFDVWYKTLEAAVKAAKEFVANPNSPVLVIVWKSRPIIDDQVDILTSTSTDKILEMNNAVFLHSDSIMSVYRDYDGTIAFLGR